MQYILWLHDRDAIISYTCVCTVDAKRKEKLQRVFSVGQRRTDASCGVDVTTRVWLAYHDDDDDDWMNRVRTDVFSLVFRRLGNPPSLRPGRNNCDCEQTVSVDIRVTARILFHHIRLREHFKRRMNRKARACLYSFEIIFNFRFRIVRSSDEHFRMFIMQMFRDVQFCFFFFPVRLYSLVPSSHRICIICTVHQCRITRIKTSNESQLVKRMLYTCRISTRVIPSRRICIRICIQLYI